MRNDAVIGFNKSDVLKIIDSLDKTYEKIAEGSFYRASIHANLAYSHVVKLARAVGDDPSYAYAYRNSRHETDMQLYRLFEAYSNLSEIVNRLNKENEALRQSLKVIGLENQSHNYEGVAYE